MWKTRDFFGPAGSPCFKDLLEMPTIQFGRVLWEPHPFWWKNLWVLEVPYKLDGDATWSQAFCGPFHAENSG